MKTKNYGFAAVMAVLGVLASSTANARDYVPLVKCEGGRVVLDLIYEDFNLPGGELNDLRRAISYQLVVHGRTFADEVQSELLRADFEIGETLVLGLTYLGAFSGDPGRLMGSGVFAFRDGDKLIAYRNPRPGTFSPGGPASQYVFEGCVEAAN